MRAGLARRLVISPLLVGWEGGMKNTGGRSWFAIAKFMLGDTCHFRVLVFGWIRFLVLCDNHACTTSEILSRQKSSCCWQLQPGAGQSKERGESV